MWNRIGTFAGVGYFLDAVHEMGELLYRREAEGSAASQGRLSHLLDSPTTPQTDSAATETGIRATLLTPQTGTLENHVMTAVPVLAWISQSFTLPPFTKVFLDLRRWLLPSMY